MRDRTSDHDRAAGIHNEVSADSRVSEGATVLIVDDDSEIRHVLRMLFELEGFEIVGEAESGLIGVALALKHDPDFVILDYMMPGLAGDETADLMRALVPEVRIVAFSAVLQEKPEWADAYLDKDRISEIAPFLAAMTATSARVGQVT